MTRLSDLFPETGKLLLTASGRDLIERLGVETARQVVLGVLKGENIREQTEPLTRRRVALVTGALLALFARGWQESSDFTDRLSTLALEQLSASTASNKADTWPAQWVIGLTGKAVQNILRSNSAARANYVRDFESAVVTAAQRCEADFGPPPLLLANSQAGQPARALTWRDLTRLTTAIGSATLTIRGSEKATYGKLFERLVLGAVLTILGFEYIEHPAASKVERVFWLSDSSDTRECDATVRLRAGKLARFDIGFIGQGNPEIMKDKLTRYASEVRQHGQISVSQTFIVVDKMPTTPRTLEAARQAGSEIVQMSMQFWPQDLARRLHTRLGYKADILAVPEAELSDYLAQHMRSMSLLRFLGSVMDTATDD